MLLRMFTWLFLSLLAAGLAVQLLLLWRQRRHVIAHRGEVPAAFSQQVTLEQHQNAADYTHANLTIAAAKQIFGALLLLAWTLGGGIEGMIWIWDRFPLNPLLAGTGLLLSIPLSNTILRLPFSFWRIFGVESRFGFNRTTPGRFLADLLLQLLLFLLLGIPLVWVILWLMQESGDRWWLFAWLVWFGFSLLISWIYPTLIAPLFNRFTPLQNDELRQQLQTLIERCGFSSDGIFVMDGSRRSSHGNAYFTGFGRSKRIVLFDTLLAHLDQAEVEAVLAHELGHYKRHHIRNHLLLGAASSFLAFWVLGWLLHQPWFYSGLGVATPSNAAALALFALVTPLVTFFWQPLIAWFQRRQEFEADDFASQQTSAAAMADSLVKLYRENAAPLSSDPFYSAFHDSHPPALVRISHLRDKQDSFAD
jgi:STE24 endopeptidase